MYYEKLKGSAQLDMVGVNCMTRDTEQYEAAPLSDKELVRCSETKKQQQIDSILQFKQQHKVQAALSLDAMKAALLAGDNSFAVLMHAVPYASLSQLTDVLYLAGGKYRRNM